MYGRPQRPAQLDSTAESLRAILSRCGIVTSMGRVKRRCRSRVHCSAVPVTHEAAEKRQARSYKQRRPLCRANDDAEVWRAIKKQCYQGTARAYCWRLYRSNCEKAWREPAAPVRAHMLPDVIYRQQTVDTTNLEGIT